MTKLARGLRQRQNGFSFVINAKSSRYLLASLCILLLLEQSRFSRLALYEVEYFEGRVEVAFVDR